MTINIKTPTYKDRLREADDKSHYRSIATKIDRDMIDLRSQVEDSETAPRRWIWELIQNAKDVHYEDGVRIHIAQKESDGVEQIVFCHNGKPFTAENIRFLIEQISSKDRKKGTDGKQKTTGKFGTGFLSTHLLSEKVTVVGIAKEPELEYRKFQVELDRSALDLDDLIEAVKDAKEAIENLDSQPVVQDFKAENFNTEFYYPLEDQQAFAVAESGISDLKSCLPYSLVFVKEILSVAINSKSQKVVYHNQDEFDQAFDDDQIFDEHEDSENVFGIVTIKMKGIGPDETEEEFSIAVMKRGYTSIAIPVKIDNGEIEIQPLDDLTPRLFCDFPLIGTEAFPLPFIVNSPNFYPTEPRDGILLNKSERAPIQAEENRKTISNAIQMYFKLLEYAGKNDWKNLHEMARVAPLKKSMKWVNVQWFNENVLDPIRKKLGQIPLVRPSYGGDLIPIFKEDGDTRSWFPSGNSKELRRRIWQLIQPGYGGSIPMESDIEIWNTIIWKECGKLTTEVVAYTIEGKETLSVLEEQFKVSDGIDLLNRYYQLLSDEEVNFDRIINKKLIFPNQNGDLALKKSLWKDSGNIYPLLKEILIDLGVDINGQLMDERIAPEFQPDEVIDMAYVVKEIHTNALKIADDKHLSEKHRAGLNKLLVWMKDYPDKAKVHFPDLYNRKYKLYDEDEVIGNMNKAEEINGLMLDYGAEKIEDLRSIIESAIKKEEALLPLTQEIISSLGITSEEEWKKAFEDKDLAALYSHASTPTKEMFQYAQNMIEKAKANIITHLKTLPEVYDLSGMDSSAKTVLTGIVRVEEEVEISIVVRPAYSGKVIIYYESERDTLDYELAELWVDKGETPQRITLGHILKTAKIVKFPI